MKKFYVLFIAIFAISFFSCSDNYCLEPEIDQTGDGFGKSNQIDMLKFDSKESFAEALNQIRNGSRSNANILKYGLTNTTVEQAYVIRDSIHFDDVLFDSTKLIHMKDLSMYIAAGYDTLVPEIEVAELLNVNGQVQIGDTIYKISPKGTYAYPASLNTTFSLNFNQLENMEGTLISEDYYSLAWGINRFDTYNQNYKTELNFDANKLPFYFLDDEIGDGSGGSNTGGSNTGNDYGTSYVSAEGRSGNSHYYDADWTKFPTYDTDDVNWFYGLWQSIFGCDKGYTYDISNNRRVKVKLYYYNYIFVASSGTYVEMQKKNWIGWSGTTAEKLFLQWDNIIFKCGYITTPDFYPADNPTYGGTVIGMVPGFRYTGNIATYFGLKLTDDHINHIKTLRGDNVIGYLRKTFGINPPSNIDVLQCATKDEVYIIIPNGWKTAYNKEKISVTFSKNVINISATLNLSDIPNEWKDFANAIKINSLKRPKLINANIYGAACHSSGTWGA